MSSSTVFRQGIHSACVGCLAGFSIGLVGWGGAQVIIPGMTHPTMSLSQLSATGISLSSLSVSTFTSGVQFLANDKVEFSTALVICFPAVISARLGTRLAHRLSGDVLSLIFNSLSIVLIPTHFWIQERRRMKTKKKMAPCDESEGLSRTIQHASFGIFSGLISSLMGVGGLPLTMSYLTETTNLPHHLVQGTAVVSVMPSILTSALSRIHAVPLTTAGIVAMSASVGGFTGAKIALLTPEERLRQFYMASLVLFGGRSMVGATRNIRNILRK